MSEGFSEVTNQSWFSRLGGAFKGIIFGLIFLVVSIVLLFWNEGRSVKRYKTLKEGSGSVISVSADSVNNDNEGKLIHLTGIVKTEDVLEDEEFGLSQNAIRFKRTVEMYQWKETTHSKKKKKLGGGTKTVKTYTYSKVWSSNIINSDKFKDKENHINKNVMEYKSFVKNAENVQIGDFDMTPELLNKINNFEFYTIPKEMDGTDSGINGFKIVDGYFYNGENPNSPDIGDVRIKYYLIKDPTVSIIAAQKGFSFAPYETKAGGTILMLVNGNVPASQMFKSAIEGNKILTWVLRFVGIFLMFLGFVMLFGPLEVLADVVPIFGTIVGVGTKFISFLLSLVISFLVIAFAWIFYRPVIGISLLVIVVLIIIFIVTKMKKH